jgi:CubicO group peptidase (beta-lactamase class C family)
VTAAVLRARLDSAIDRAIEQRRIVGTVVLVAHHGELVYSRAAGLADRETQTPMKANSIFLLASVTKPIVTAAAMGLIEDNVLGLEDPVTRWLPDFRPRLASGAVPAITVQHLLTHTAGLSYRSFEPAGSAYHALNVSDGLDQPGLSLAENLRRLGEAPLVCEPGRAWRYSLATDVLGAVIAEASGEPLQVAVRDRITGPLGMTDTDFSVVDQSRFATPYADGEGEPKRMTDGMAVSLFGTPVTFTPTRIFHGSSYASGGAGMAGTALDVMRLFEAVRIGRDGVLRASTVARMLTPHVNSSAQTWGPGWGFGLGWAILDDPQATATPQPKGTIQWGGVYGHTWFVDRANSLSVVALTNTTFEGMSGNFPVDVRDAVYAALQS